MCEKLLEKLTFSLLLSQPLTKFPLNETYIQQKCDDFFFVLHFNGLLQRVKYPLNLNKRPNILLIFYLSWKSRVPPAVFVLSLVSPVTGILYATASLWRCSSPTFVLIAHHGSHNQSTQAHLSGAFQIQRCYQSAGSPCLPHDHFNAIFSTVSYQPGILLEYLGIRRRS